MMLCMLAPLLSSACDEALDEDTPYIDDELGEVEDRLFAGVNGDACAESPYNCKLRVYGGNRVATNDPTDDNAWALNINVPVRDGNGTVQINSTRTSSTFNFGQTRSFAGETHVFAVSTSNSSAGWMPLSAIKGADSFAAKVGHVSALGAGLDKLGCYAIKNSHDTVLEPKKVVYDAQTANERAGDYLPLIRKNGKRSANLTFNVPGFALGGVAVDHFPAGTKFQRLDVPTNGGAPSIDIPLYVADSEGRFRKQSGTMKFIYGYVIAATGTKRNGWMAYDALQVSSGCP